MKITYYHTLYKRNCTDITNKVNFTEQNGVKGIEYKAFGKGKFIEMEYVVSIEETEEWQ